MTGRSDGCLHRPGGRTKTAGATVYLMEELGDARLRCDQLMRYIDEAVQLIEKSDKKDHFFEVAGHLIQGIPETAFKLEKALQAVALAADRIDYEEIKQELRPEKVEELERVLKDVRIRPVKHRSENPMKPKEAASRLREFAKITREEGSLPLHDVAAFIADLGRTRQANASPVADTLDRMAFVLESGQAVSRQELATVIYRMAGEAEVEMALRLASKPRFTQEHMQLGNVEEVKKKFKAENPDITDEQLNEIADQWKKNKDVVKDKTAVEPSDDMPAHFETIRAHAIAASRAANAFRWRPALMSLFYIVDEIGTVLVKLGSMDTQKSEALKREIRQQLPQAAHNIEEMSPMSVMAAGDLQPRDATEVGQATERMLDSARKASAAVGQENWKKVLFHTIGVLDGVYLMGNVFEVPEVGFLMRARKGFVSYSGARPTTNFSASETLKIAAEADISKLYHEMAAHLDTFDMSWSRYEKDPEKNKAKLADALRYMKALRDVADVVIRNLEAKSSKTASDESPWKTDDAAGEEAKRSRFEQGKPADPTENMDPGDAKKWKSENDEHKDNFKAAKLTTHLEGKKGHTLCGEEADPKTLVDSPRDATCYYCKQAWEKKHASTKTALGPDGSGTLSKFEEGKPADPTENMSPEDAKRWKEEHDKHKDNFKSAYDRRAEEDFEADPDKEDNSGAKKGEWTIFVRKYSPSRWSYTVVNPQGGSGSTGAYTSAQGALSVAKHRTDFKGTKSVKVIQQVWEPRAEEYVTKKTWMEDVG